MHFKNISKSLAKIFFLIALLPCRSWAAMPLVTDSAGIANHKQLVIETYTESWRIPAKGATQQSSSHLYGQSMALTYGFTKWLEVMISGMAGYDKTLGSVSLMNPFIQAKSQLTQPKNPALPALGIEVGYVNRNGVGQYYDTATNYYAVGIATSSFLNGKFLTHINFGMKSSHDLHYGQPDLYRPQLGVAIDFAPFRNDIRLFAESYNGAQNSPRDSPGYFHSYQGGVKFTKSKDLEFNILYGTQPTFSGYDENGSRTFVYTNWMQFGIRKTFDNFVF